MSDIEEMNTSKDFSENDCLGKFYQRGCQEVLSKIYLNLTMESIEECRKVSKGWNMIIEDQIYKFRFGIHFLMILGDIYVTEGFGKGD